MLYDIMRKYGNYICSKKALFNMNAANNLKRIILCLVLIIGVVGISGCTDSVSQSTKHFDNGFIAFDYPSNMKVQDHGSYFITVTDGSQSMLNTATSDHTVIDNTLKYPNPNFTITNKTINGRTAYNMIQKSGDTSYYFTLIDIGARCIQILPSADPNVPDQKDTSYYKTYQVIVNSFHVKKLD